MKKGISCLLILTMMVAMIIPVSAENSIGDFKGIKFAEYVGHGEFEISEGLSMGLINENMNTLSDGDRVRVIETEDEEIYKINDNKYLTLAYDNKYLLSDKIDVCIDDYESNHNMFERYEISQNLRDEIIAIADHAMDSHGSGDGCKELEVPYGIPFSCTRPKEYDNMFVACRGASFSHIAASSARLSRTMLSLGEGVGNKISEIIKNQ